MTRSRDRFEGAKAADAAMGAAGINPRGIDIAASDLLEQLIYWCEFHKVSFDEQLAMARNRIRDMDAEPE